MKKIDLASIKKYDNAYLPGNLKFVIQGRYL